MFIWSYGAFRTIYRYSIMIYGGTYVRTANNDAYVPVLAMSLPLSLGSILVPSSPESVLEMTWIICSGPSLLY